MDVDRPVRLGPPLRGWRRWLARGRHHVLDMVDAIDLGEVLVGLVRLISERLF